MLSHNPVVVVNEADALLCPQCDGEFLHHGLVSVNPHPEGRFSPTIVLSMDCEVCGRVGALQIEQHEGRTLLRWV